MNKCVNIENLEKCLTTGPMFYPVNRLSLILQCGTNATSFPGSLFDDDVAKERILGTRYCRLFYNVI